MTTFSENDPFAKSVDMFMTPNTKSNEENDTVDSLMGIIIANSEGLLDNGNGEGYAYASRVYLNNIKHEFQALLTLKDQAHKAEVEEAQFTVRLSEHPERLALWNEAVEEGRRRESGNKASMYKMIIDILDKSVTVAIDEHGLFNIKMVSVNDIEAIAVKYGINLTPLPESDKTN